MLKPQKISITGASGFIGSYLLHHLINRNFSLTVLDKHDATYPKEVKVVKGNLLTKDGLSKFLEEAEIVIHLAGQVLPGDNSMEIGNVKTTENLISETSKHVIKKIIFSSSVAVYGSSDKSFFKESDMCYPDTEYGLSKLKAEEIIKEWGKNNNNQYSIFRFPSIYGPNNEKGVVYAFCNDLIKKGIITIQGDGKQERDFVFIEDAVKLLSYAVDSNLEGTYNVGTGKNYSLLDLVSILEKISGEKCEKVYEFQDDNKINRISYSVEKLKKKMRWLPETNLEAGMKPVYKSLIN